MELAFNWKKQAPPSLTEKHPGKIGDIPRNLNYVFVKGRPLRVQVQPCARRSATLRSAKCSLALGEVQPCARRSATLHSAKCNLALGEVQPCARRSATLHSRQPMEGFSAADGAGKKKFRNPEQFDEVDAYARTSLICFRLEKPARSLSPRPPRKNWGYSTGLHALFFFRACSIIFSRCCATSSIG